MSEGIRAALIGAAAGTITQLLIFAAIFGGIWIKVKSHSALLDKLPCLKPHCPVFDVKAEQN